MTEPHKQSVINKLKQASSSDLPLQSVLQQALRDIYGTDIHGTETKPPPPPQAPAEAQEHFKRALSIETKEGDTRALHEKASELMLAINKAEGFYPSAHAELGMTLLLLGDENRARQELNIALQQDSNHVYARGMLILMELEKLGIPTALRPTGSSLVFDLVSLGVGSIVAQSKVNALSAKIDELVRAYPAYLSQFVYEPDDAGMWIFSSEIMLWIHDELQNVKGLSGRDRLARAVLNAPWDMIYSVEISEEDAKQIAEIRQRAEGRFLLSK